MEFIFDKNNEIHRIVEFLVGILEKKYAIGLSKKSIEEILKVLQKNIKKEPRFILPELLSLT